MKSLLFIIFWSFPLISMGQNPSNKDYENPEKLALALLETISGKKGEPRDWERFQNLFTPDAQLHAIRLKGDSIIHQSFSVEEFIERTKPFYSANGFREYAFETEVKSFGHIAQVFQPYGASVEGKGEIARGVNVYEMVFKKGRWWISYLNYEAESEKVRLNIKK